MPTLAHRHPLVEVVLADECPSKACKLDQTSDHRQNQPQPEQNAAGVTLRLTPVELAAEYRRWIVAFSRAARCSAASLRRLIILTA